MTVRCRATSVGQRTDLLPPSSDIPNLNIGSGRRSIRRSLYRPSLAASAPSARKAIVFISISTSISMISLNTNRSLILDGLAILFGISSWISINGLWVELPLLVDQLPESWALASYLSIIIQIANLGPICYGIYRYAYPHKNLERYIIVGLLLVGVAASLCLILFWDRTTILAGQEHSTALFVLVFALSMVDCTSSVLFLPFMATFRSIYLNSYLIGEGMSGFLPAVIALMQGVGGNPYCANVTDSVLDADGNSFVDYKEVAVYPDPRFSVEVFFVILMVMVIVSAVAFILMNVVPSVRSELVTDQNYIAPTEEAGSYDQVTPSGSGVKDSQSTEAPVSFPSLDSENSDWKARNKFYGFLALQAYLCFISNGAFPSIQTYSCLPFGNVVYHLSVTLNAMANPVMAFMAFFCPCRSSKLLLGLTAAGTLFSGFILATSLESPNQLWGPDVGGALTVLSWVIYGGLFSYVKVSIAGWCWEHSRTALFWCGAWTQIGSAFGAALSYVLVNELNVFHQYYIKCES
eukprot:TCALIF_00763-PA protein Name:"Similar to slc52a3a Solute carrier family 52, riboflavin transporter, member 3-A (Danio rerio)" AED:0.04 eAED:0.04 QI:0/0.5/0.4/0.6/1/1/5/1316/520